MARGFLTGGPLTSLPPSFAGCLVEQKGRLPPFPMVMEAALSHSRKAKKHFGLNVSNGQSIGGQIDLFPCFAFISFGPNVSQTIKRFRNVSLTLLLNLDTVENFGGVAHGVQAIFSAGI